MLDSTIAQEVIFEALNSGADFCDIFVERSQIEDLSFNSSVVKNVRSGVDFGVGVRLIFGKQAVYGYTNSKDKNDLVKLTQKLATQFKKERNQQLNVLPFKLKQASQIKSYGDSEVAVVEKINHLKTLDKKIRNQSEYIQQVNLSYMQRTQEVEIFDSEGLHVKDTRPYVRLGVRSYAKDGDQQATGSWNPGARGGYEFFNSLNFDEIADYVTRQAVTIMRAKDCPAGKMPVVIDNGFGGVIFHEACGHPLETTAVEKKASVFWDKKGEMIAHENLSAVDDGTVDHLWGSLTMDDEGMATQKTQLIKNGRLENFLCDRMGEIKTGHPRTGSARRESYKYAPASRMRNTFIEAGPHSKDDLIQAMGDGIYAKAMGGGSVNPGTGEFNFSVQEGYIVKNGKISEPIKGATLIGKGEDIMKNISMVGSNLEYAAGMCGSVSGGVPVTVGQPAVKVDQILVGGKA
ncbi:MAG: peptidase C69 [Halobacteriovoraceae bacterium]|nr:peptidase C69 [Halobacteriovoraceae bacterium]